MAKPLRTNNPSEWTALDGVYIDEIRPPGRITTRGSAVVCIVGQFQMGPYDATIIGSSKHLTDTFGTGSYSGFKALLNKRYSNLVIKRVTGTGAKSAFGNLMDAATTPAASVKCEALSDGIYGNGLKAKATPVSGDATKFTLTATWGTQVQTWTGVDLSSFPITGLFMKFTKADGATQIPKTTPDQEITLSQGSDGTFSDSEYTTAINDLEAYEGITILFADDTSTNVNSALITHCNKMGDRYPILALPSATTKTAVVTAAASYRAALDRGSLVWPWLYQYNYYSNQTELSNPAAWAASILSMIPEEWDPAITDAAQYLAGVKGLEYNNLTRQDYIDLKNAGIMAFEFDNDYGYKIKSGVTLSTDAALSMVFRRRMTDLITTDIAIGLKPYQNRPMNEDNTTDVIGAITAYLDGLKGKKRIADFVVDGESMNTANTMANGEFHVLIYVRLYSSMRYIVLHAQVGESVVITELDRRVA